MARDTALTNFVALFSPPAPTSQQAAGAIRQVINDIAQPVG